MKARMFAAIIISTLLAVWVPGNTRSQTNQRCFPETGFCIEGRIREFWEQNGGLPIFGYPITPQRVEVVEGRPFQAQWFERERFELHPENAPPYDVLLGRLGAERLSQLGRDWQAEPRAGGPQPGCLWFEQTGHNVCDQADGVGFMTYWRSHGLLDPRLDAYGRSLALFGLPLSDPMTETLSDGRQYTVQWFERARFEWHPENGPPYNVLLGLLGREVLDSQATANPRIAFPPQSLEGLTGALAIYGLTTSDVNVAKTVTYALPRPNSIVVQSAPLLKPSQSDRGMVLGVLNAARLLGSASNPSVQVLPQAYVVVVRNGQLQLVPRDADPRNVAAKLDVRQRTATFATPDSVITNDLVCYGPDPARHDQFCIDLSAKMALTPEEASTISDAMRASLNTLQVTGLLKNGEGIDTAETIPAAEGFEAVSSQQASILVAPASKPFSTSGERPLGGLFSATQQISNTQLVSGTLVGSLAVTLTVKLASPAVTIPPGVYTVRLVSSSQPPPNEWNVRLEGENGVRIEIPANLVEVLGAPRSPQVALGTIYITFTNPFNGAVVTVCIM